MNQIARNVYTCLLPGGIRSRVWPPVPTASEAPQSIFLSTLLKCLSTHVWPYEKIGEYLETPKYISGELQKVRRHYQMPRVPGASPEPEPWSMGVGGTGREPTAPNSAFS